jgi:hypothetical protein
LSSTFIDSNIFIAFANKKDRDHNRSLELLDRVRKREISPAYSSDYVFDETVTTALIRTRRPSTAIKAGKLILGSEDEGIPRLVRIIRVDERIFSEAWETFKTQRFEGLSFTDHTILAQLREFRIDTLTSFDSAFDGLAPRLS